MHFLIKSSYPSFSFLRSERIISLFRLLLLVLVVVLSLIRCLGVSVVPPGFFVDEAAAAAQILCLANFHTNCQGESWPFFTQLWGAARVGPVYQYSGAVWSTFFGGSIESLRTLSAFYGLGTIFVLSLLAKRLGGERLQFWTVLAALISPWSVHSSRIAWDPPLAPFFLVSTPYLFYRAYESSRFRLLLLAAAGVSALLASLAYPPVLAQLVFLLGFLFLFSRFLFPGRIWFILQAVGISCMFIASIALFDTDPVHGRVSEVGIFGNDSRNPTAHQGVWARLVQFVENIYLHFSSDFLLLKGEFNLRHLPSGFGVFTWADSVAFILLCVILLFVWLQGKNVREFMKNERAAFLLGIVGLLSAFMAASLTWDSLPHGLRSIGGWPFAALLAGAVMSLVSTKRIPLIVLVIAIAAHCLFFYRYYFFRSQDEFAWWFDRDVTEAAQSMSEEEWNDFAEKRRYPSLAKMYFSMEYFGIMPESLEE